MKYCVNTYSFGAYGNPDRLGIYGMIDKAAQLGYDGIEFTESYWLDTTDSELAKIGGYVKERGLDIFVFNIQKIYSFNAMSLC